MSTDVRLFSDEIRRRERERRRSEPKWALLSFLLHLLAFAAIVFLTPVKELVMPEKAEPEPMVVSADRLEEMAETLQESRVQELLRQLEDMQSVLHNMDVMKEQLAKDYDALAEQGAVDVRQQMEDLVREAQRQMDAAQAAQEALQKEAEALAKLEQSADLTQKEVAQELYRQAARMKEELSESTATAQANAANALDRLQVKAEFAGFQKTAEAAQVLHEAQTEAARTQDKAQDAVVATAERLAAVERKTNDVKRQEKRLADNEAWQEKHREQAAQARQKLAAAEQARAEAEERAAAAEKAMAEASSQVEALKAEKKFGEAKQVQPKVAAARKERDRARSQAANAQRQIQEAKKTIEREERSLASDVAKHEQFEKDRQVKVRELEEARKAVEQVPACQRQLVEARNEQNALQQRLEVLKATMAADVAQRENLSRAANRQENPLVDARPPASLADAFDMAKRLETEITESYRDIKASQTAITRQMSFKAAKAITDVARPDRLEADRAALEAKPRTQADFDRQKKAQADVVREADTMVEATVAMMNEAMEIVTAGLPKRPDLGKLDKPHEIRRLEDDAFAKQDDAAAQAARLAAMKAESDYQLELEAAAAEDDGQKAKDMAELMAKQDAKAEEAKAKAEEKGEDAAPGEEGAVARNTGELQGPPPLEGGDLALVPGNIMDLSGTVDGAAPAKWMYVNSWYVIGPFPNPNRANLRRKFAPESVQDLDASYVGEGGKVLRWQFVQAKNYDERNPWNHKESLKNAAKVMPDSPQSYAIYYAYAEVFMDRDCDRWVAIGSDDRSDAWVNDMPVWGSSNKLKSWKLAEDYRRVHFKKGRNRILVRIENGWYGMGWSFCISVDDAKSTLH